MIVKGIVIPVSWNQAGEVIKVAVSSHDEEEYTVENLGKGKELLTFLNAEVEVEGKIVIEAGVKKVRVREYRVNRIWQ